MARGKQTCKILKEIRRQIAEANDIEYVTSECRYKGDCLGTCPKCEAELRYLEQQLHHRQLMGHAVALVGLSAGMMTLYGCSGASSQTTEDSHVRHVEPVERVAESVVSDDVRTAEAEDTSCMKMGEVGSGDEAVAKPSAVRSKSAETVATSDLIAREEAIEREEIPRHSERVVFGASPEIMPVFPGGDAALVRFVEDNVQFPDSCEQLEGKVVTQFCIDTTGCVTEAKIVRNPLPEAYGEEALRVVRLLPKFTPGKFYGVPTQCWYTLPVKFKRKE